MFIYKLVPEPISHEIIGFPNAEASNSEIPNASVRKCDGKINP